MKIQTAEFTVSNTDYKLCPKADRPEFAFIGRSNVGKSSLINMLTNNKKLAKTSSTPGKTQTINHFLINQQWYLVDLPGYGFASVSQSARKSWSKMIEDYLLQRENLCCTIVLVDARHELQKNDFDFISWMGEKSLPIAIALTKADKLKPSQLAQSRKKIQAKLLDRWEVLPPMFTTSAEKKTGRDELLDFIDQAQKNYEID
jgi:ribosome biogenesis GTP-binding protein YsxC/EngB